MIASKLAAFRDDHERFGVDLDKFERQMVSYGLSQGPYRAFDPRHPHDS